MPIYQYRCDKCNEYTEQMQKASDPPPGECPSCSAAGALRKVIAPVGVIFKGSGFHKNDYTGKSSKPSSSSSTDTSANSGDSKSEPKTEPKTEAKTESKPASGGDGKVA